MAPRNSCIYQTIGSVVLPSGEWIGQKTIIDMSDCKDASILNLLRKGYIETADGEPTNTPMVARVDCPCDKE